MTYTKPANIFEESSGLEGISSNPLRDRLDRPLKDLRISVIDQCNLRCIYCMPTLPCGGNYTFLQENERLSFHEITRLVKLFACLGVSKIRLTGGEPLLRENLDQLILEINAIKGISDCALTTNGVLLSQHAKRLKTAGLRRITVSLDTLDETIFSQMTGRKGLLPRVLEGIRVAEQAGFGSIKINVVVRRDMNDQAILDIIRYFKGTRHIVRFIEYMDAGNINHWQSQQVVSSREIFERIDKIFPLEPLSPNYPGEVATRYHYQDGDGEIGFVSSVTQPFCGSCTRARVSTDGSFYTCLFSEEGKDLRRLLRNSSSDNEILDFIQDTWEGRADRYSEDRAENIARNKTRKKIEMYQIGG